MKVIVTGACGLIGSEAALWHDRRGDSVVGVDNNMRRDFFGEKGDTTWMLKTLQETTRRYRHVASDIRDRAAMNKLWEEFRPDLIIHCAAQPSHDLAALRPLDDFDVNAVGTINLLEATRQFAPEAVFVLLSTNKVYGDSPNHLPLVEHATRYDYADPADHDGIKETQPIDHCLHSVFGASKVAADVMAQEYGRYYGLRTGIFRGGCLTGPSHSGVELHGFLNHLVKVAVSGKSYTIFGYKGKQVRDQIHSYDVVRAVDAYFGAPRCAAVYNIGGGRESNASILECIQLIEERLGRPITRQYQDVNRVGDHICYISDITKLKTDYPDWGLSYLLTDIIDELLESELAKVHAHGAK